MGTDNMSDLAFVIAEFAHKGQKDKAGEDYILHPVFVASKMGNDEERTVAFLHDIIEDTFIKEDTIRNLFGDSIADAVVLLTRKENENYYDYIKRVKENPVAVKVKLQDLRHNMDLGRLKKVTEKDLKRVEKYKKASEYLIKGEEENGYF